MTELWELKRQGWHFGWKIFVMQLLSRGRMGGCRQLRKLETNLAHRRRLTQLYAELLAPHGFQPPERGVHRRDRARASGLRLPGERDATCRES